MKAIKLTPEQIKKDDGREYNPQVWEENVEKYMERYSDVQFYKVPKGNGYEYNRYFVVYTLPEGLRLLGKFGYSSSITNGGFQEAMITSFDYKEVDGKWEVTPFADNEVNIEGFKFRSEDEKGNVVNDAWINTSKEAREWMTKRSKRFGSIFTKEGLQG